MIFCVRNGPHRRGGASSMIEMRRAQLSFGDGLIAEEGSDLREDWMEHAVAVLADEDIVAAVYEALARRHAKSRSRGPRLAHQTGSGFSSSGTPATAATTCSSARP